MMTEQTKHPKPNEFWLTRGGERRYVIGRMPAGIHTRYPLISVDDCQSKESHTNEGKVLCETEESDDDLVEHLPWCTSFDDPEPVAETVKIIDVNPGDGYRWLEDDEIVQSIDEVFRPDLAPCWVPPLTRAGKTVKHFDPDDYPVRRKLNHPAQTCPDCNAPLTAGHADVCPMTWVTQDRVRVRTGVDQVRWSDWEDGLWVDGNSNAVPQRHGEVIPGVTATLQVRCRRKDLPPLPSPEPSAPDPGEGWRLLERGEEIKDGDEWKFDDLDVWIKAGLEVRTVNTGIYRRCITPAEVHPLGPHSSETDTVPVRLFSDTATDQIYMVRPGGAINSNDDEVLIVGKEFRLRKASPTI